MGGKTEDGGLKTEDGGRMAEDRGGRLEIWGRLKVGIGRGAVDCFADLEVYKGVFVLQQAVFEMFRSTCPCGHQL